MNRMTLSIASLILTTGLIAPAWSQPQPPPPERPQQPQPPQPPGPEGRGGPGLGEFGQQGGGGFGPRGGEGGGRGGRGGGGGFARGPLPEAQKYETLRAYIDVVDQFTKLTESPTAAGVAAVVSATDMLRQRGPEGAITYLTKILPEVKNPAVERAIRIQLADLYKQSGQSDKALEQLDALMKGSLAPRSESSR